MKNWKVYLMIAMVFLLLEIGVAYKAQTLVALIPLGLGSIIFFIMFIAELKFPYYCSCNHSGLRHFPDKEKIKKEIEWAKSELLRTDDELDDVIRFLNKCKRFKQ